MSTKNPNAIGITAVAVTRKNNDGELYLGWLLEGGICELEHPGVLLIVADDANLTGDDGHGQVYTVPQPAPVVPEVVERIRSLLPRFEAGVSWTGEDTAELAEAAFDAAELLAAAPAQGQQVECQECERLRERYECNTAIMHARTERLNAVTAELAALKAQQAEDSDTVRRICDLFGIGSKARTQAAIMANVENAHKFARMLDAIEAEFFMVPGEIDPDYPDDQPYDCLVNCWSSTPEQYVEQFRAALEALKAQQVGQVGQEPVATVKENPYCPDGLSDEITEYLPVDTKLYTTPQPDAGGLAADLACDRAYRNGLMAGYSFGCSGDEAGYQRSLCAYQAQIQAVAHDKQSGYMAGAPLLSTAAQDVLAERNRQITAEGWTPAHDDEHANFEMADAAGCYAHSAAGWNTYSARDRWPWSLEWWKPTTPRRDLIKAGALILAEVERLDRAAAKQAEQEQQP